MRREDAIAWVESPLQLIGAAEWAHRVGRAVPVAGRLTTQMGRTADELIDRGALFGRCEPFMGIPWSLLSQHRHWLVGDGFSGQFRLASAVLRPQCITFLDDGASTVAFAATVLGDRPYRRPGVAEGRASTLAAPFALERIARLAGAGRVEVFTAFDLGAQVRRRLRDRGVEVTGHRFEWTRASAPQPALSAARVVLGSARPVDGWMPRGEYLDWLVRIAASGDAVYLPHRRETRAQLDDVERIAGLEIVEAGIPAELVLAGAGRRLELFTLPSSTTTTLDHVLAGTGSVIRSEPSGAPGRAVRSSRAGRP